MGMLRHRLLLASCAALALALSALTGCEDASDGAGGTGRMELISREPVRLAPPNLLSNGGFEEWVAGAPAPAHFGAPSEELSSLTRETTEVAEGKVAARQTWRRSDGRDSFWRQYRVAVEGLVPDKTYRLSVRAKNLSRNTAIIAASEVDMTAPPSKKGERPLVKIANVLRVEPAAEFREYTGTFQTSPTFGGYVLLSVACLADAGDFPATVIWDDWRLAETGETEH